LGVNVSSPRLLARILDFYTGVVQEIYERDAIRIPVFIISSVLR
jgi:hypothetical protein